MDRPETGRAAVAAHPSRECTERIHASHGRLHLALRELDQVVELQEQAEAKLDALARDNADVQRRAPIPGVGPRTAEAVVAFLPKPERFRTGKQVSAYGGFVPRQYQSSEGDRRGRISKRGPKTSATALAGAPTPYRRRSHPLRLGTLPASETPRSGAQERRRCHAEMPTPQGPVAPARSFVDPRGPSEVLEGWPNEWAARRIRITGSADGLNRAATPIVERIPKASAARRGTIGLRAGVSRPPCLDPGAHCRPLDPR